MLVRALRLAVPLVSMYSIAPTNAEGWQRAKETDERRDGMASTALSLSRTLGGPVLEIAREKFADDPECSMMSGLRAATGFLKNVHETRWPATIVSDTDKFGERIMRSMGLSLINVPEIVMCFDLDDQDVALGIFKDLVTMAVDDPNEARAKIVPGRRVIAYRFGRKYYMHCALSDPCGCDICENEDEDTSELKTEGGPVWDAMEPFVPNFRAVQIVLLPPEPGAPAVNRPSGPRCSHCDVRLPEQQYKRCPCQAVQYCNRECQKKHWRLHKTMCSRNASIEQQLRRGELAPGSRV